jgi:hypothetical protein
VLLVVDIGFCMQCKQGPFERFRIELRERNLRVEDSLRPRRADVVKSPRPRIILEACAERMVMIDRADIIFAVVVLEVDEVSSSFRQGV